MKQAIFTGSGVALVTPFTSGGVDYPALEKLLEDGNLEGAQCREKQRLHFAELNNMYMTGKDIDAVIKRVSFTVSEGINIAIGETFAGQ